MAACPEAARRVETKAAPHPDQCPHSSEPPQGNAAATLIYTRLSPGLAGVAKRAGCVVTSCCWCDGNPETPVTHERGFDAAEMCACRVAAPFKRSSDFFSPLPLGSVTAQARHHLLMRAHPGCRGSLTCASWPWGGRDAPGMRVAGVFERSLPRATGTTYRQEGHFAVGRN